MKLALNTCSIPGPVLSDRIINLKENMVPALKGVTSPCGQQTLKPITKAEWQVL